MKGYFVGTYRGASKENPQYMFSWKNEKKCWFGLKKKALKRLYEYLG